MKENKIIDKVESIVKPAVEELGYELYYVEYVVEEGEKYLRIYIDKTQGINLSDCEKVSRKISSLLDEYDPIEEHYMLEVSSPGIERGLFTDKHLLRYLNSQVNVSLINEAIKKTGSLVSFDDEEVTLSMGDEKEKIKRENISRINLKGDF
ncbi:MAG: ribosome maturation factor RimP [Clostridiaceae bacterium]